MITLIDNSDLPPEQPDFKTGEIYDIQFGKERGYFVCGKGSAGMFVTRMKGIQPRTTKSGRVIKDPYDWVIFKEMIYHTPKSGRRYLTLRPRSATKHKYIQAQMNPMIAPQVAQVAMIVSGYAESPTKPPTGIPPTKEEIEKDETQSWIDRLKVRRQ